MTIIEPTTLSANELRVLALLLDKFEEVAGATSADGNTYVTLDHAVVRVNSGRGKVRIEWDDGCWTVSGLLDAAEDL